METPLGESALTRALEGIDAKKQTSVLKAALHDQTTEAARKHQEDVKAELATIAEKAAKPSPQMEKEKPEAHGVTTQAMVANVVQASQVNTGFVITEEWLAANKLE
jgi:hypothetical protein